MLMPDRSRLSEKSLVITPSASTAALLPVSLQLAVAVCSFLDEARVNQLHQTRARQSPGVTSSMSTSGQHPHAASPATVSSQLGQRRRPAGRSAEPASPMPGPMPPAMDRFSNAERSGRRRTDRAPHRQARTSLPSSNEAGPSSSSAATGLSCIHMACHLAQELAVLTDRIAH